MTRILVPCDFSTANEKAIQFAVNLAHQEDELFLLHIISDSSVAANLNMDMKEADLKFQNMTTPYLRTSIALHSKILSGKFLPSILNFIKHEKIDLIVMGTQGSRGWSAFFMGSHIEKVVRTSPVPVFAVRESVNLKSIHDIVFPCNLKLDQAEILSKVKDLQKQFRSRLHLLRINTGKLPNAAELTEKLEAYATHYQLSNFTVTVLTEVNVTTGILNFIREINADMIAMITHRKRDLRHMFTECITADIVNHAAILAWTCTR